MPTYFPFPSSDPVLFERASKIADAYTRQYMREGIAGVVLLGSVVRGYFDSFADIDVGIFKEPGADMPPPAFYQHIDGIEIQTFFMDLAQEQQTAWDMSKRWAYSTHRVVYDPRGEVARLLAQKIPLKPEERRWLMIEGMSSSFWRCDGLPKLWISRGDLVSAQYMFNAGIDHFFDVLFGLNNELVADIKWRYYAARQLPLLPPGFEQTMQAVLRVEDFSEADIRRRMAAFMRLWQAVLPLVEAQVGMTFAEFSALV